MKYLIIGAGGTGAPLAAYMTKSAKDVTLLARGQALDNIRKNGLVINTVSSSFSVKVKVSSQEEYSEKPDVIFLCVKSYSVDGLIGFLRRVSGKGTVIIPLLNIYTTGEYLSKKLPDSLVTDGCIYISANITSPGEIFMHAEIFRVVFGVRDGESRIPELEKVKSDLCESGIFAVVSDNIRRDAMKKFSYVSPAAACGLYYDCTAERMQREGRERSLFSALIEEVTMLSKAMGIDMGMNMVKVNLGILDKLAPTASTSMQRDIEKAGQSEIDGLIHDVVRRGREYGLDLKNYEMISKKFSNKN